MKHNFSRMFALAPIAAAVMMLGIASPAAASTESYSFGDLLSGQTGPDNSSIWGNLSVTTDPSKTYTFLLSLNSNFSTLFGSGAYVSDAIFNTPSSVDPTSATIDSGSWGVAGVALDKSAPNVGGTTFDFGDCFGTITPGGTCSFPNTSSGRLIAGESVKWDTTFSVTQGDPLLFSVPPVGLHVRSISTGSSDSAWYGVTSPVPEPETYAMLLAGLGLVGFSARRRMNT